MLNVGLSKEDKYFENVYLISVLSTKVCKKNNYYWKLTSYKSKTNAHLQLCIYSSRHARSNARTPACPHAPMPAYRHAFSYARTTTRPHDDHSPAYPHVPMPTHPHASMPAYPHAPMPKHPHAPMHQTHGYPYVPCPHTHTRSCPHTRTHARSAGANTRLNWPAKKKSTVKNGLPTKCEPSTPLIAFHFNKVSGQRLAHFIRNLHFSIYSCLPNAYNVLFWSKLMGINCMNLVSFLIILVIEI